MSTALYNRYRPTTFAEVVGQEHVTGALQQALRSGRVHHAYLFSGPRGCGKTSSARILAASLNCIHGPTPTPCGECDECVGIRTGSSMDVIEIDAASHGLVDDARDLRERAFFAPASARYKVYVVDEAHMVTTAAFNALLKVVEEPPPYLKFIFATTEPDKVISTIRSRTHHYAFRLVPPNVLREHLAYVAMSEGVEVEPSVLPLVVRAGAGSVRDALSVLDQLMAGAGPEGLRYEAAVALLGLTDGVLLDEVLDALAAHDGATVFGVVDRVVSSGHDPRRFAADLLERLRDLIILEAVPDAADRGLLEGCSPDQLDRMRGQAARMGAAELSRAADVVNAGLVEMRGTTSPRLLLELVLARALLPGAATDPASVMVRLDRLERRTDVSGFPASGDGADDGGGAAAARQALAGGNASGRAGDGSSRAGGGTAGSGGSAPTGSAPTGSAPTGSAPTGSRATSGAVAGNGTAGGNRPARGPAGSADTGRGVTSGAAGGSGGTGNAGAGSGSTSGAARSRPAGTTGHGDAEGGAAESGSAGGRPAGRSSEAVGGRGAAGGGANARSGSGGGPTGARAQADGRTAGDEQAEDGWTTSAPTARPGGRPSRPVEQGGPWDAPPVGTPVPHQPQPHQRPAQEPTSPTPPTPGGVDAAALRRVWEDVLRAVGNRRRTPQALLREHASVAAVHGDQVVLAFKTRPTARYFESGQNVDILREALAEVVGGRWRVTVEVDPAGQAPPPGPGRAAADPPPGFAPGDEPSPDDEDAPGEDGPRLSGEDAALRLLRSDLGATVVDQREG